MEGPAELARGAVLLCDKPAGVTSHDVVSRVRRSLGIRRVGHAGTLDPFATGLLVVLLGRATRLQRYFVGLRKTYRAVARLGWTSSTGDPDGELIHTGDIPDRLELPTGELIQRIPMTSAVKVGGERLYAKAHRGEVVETPERPITVYRADLVEARAEEAEFEIECSSGTYVRTLVEQLGDAYCSALRRTAIGGFRIEDASDEPIALERALGFLPERSLTAPEAEAVRHGRSLPGELTEGPVRLTHAGTVLAVAEPSGSETKPVVVLA